MIYSLEKNICSLLYILLHNFFLFYSAEETKIFFKKKIKTVKSILQKYTSKFVGVGQERKWWWMLRKIKEEKQEISPHPLPREKLNIMGEWELQDHWEQERHLWALFSWTLSSSWLFHHLVSKMLYSLTLQLSRFGFCPFLHSGAQSLVLCCGFSLRPFLYCGAALPLMIHFFFNLEISSSPGITLRVAYAEWLPDHFSWDVLPSLRYNE